MFIFSKIPIVKIIQSHEYHKNHKPQHYKNYRPQHYKSHRPKHDIYTPCDIQNDPSLKKQWRSQIHYCEHKSFILPTPNGTHIKDVIDRI